MCIDQWTTIRITYNTSCTAWLGGLFPGTWMRYSKQKVLGNQDNQLSVPKQCKLSLIKYRTKPDVSKSSISPSALKLNFSVMLLLVFLALLSMLETNARAAEDVTCSDIGNTVMSENEMVLSHGDRKEKVPLDIDARVWTVTPGVTVLSSDT